MSLYHWIRGKSGYYRVLATVVQMPTIHDVHYYTLCLGIYTGKRNYTTLLESIARTSLLDEPSLGTGNFC